MKKITKKSNYYTGLGAIGIILGVVLIGTAPVYSDECGHSWVKSAKASHAQYLNKDIVDTAISADSFGTLVAAVKAAGLVDVLKGDGPFTVFAPTDEAFSKLPKGTLENLLKPENREQLQSILTYHVVPGKVMANEVVNLQKATTVNGKDLVIKVKDGVVLVDNARVLKTDIDCSNGIIHVIDTVVLPKM